MPGKPLIKTLLETGFINKPGARPFPQLPTKGLKVDKSKLGRKFEHLAALTVKALEDGKLSVGELLALGQALAGLVTNSREDAPIPQGPPDTNIPDFVSVDGMIPPPLEPVVEIAQDIGEAIPAVVDAVESIQEPSGAVIDALQQVEEEIKDIMEAKNPEDATTQVFEAIGEIGEAVPVIQEEGGVIADAVQAVGDAVEGIADKVKGLFDGPDSKGEKPTKGKSKSKSKKKES